MLPKFGASRVPLSLPNCAAAQQRLKLVGTLLSIAPSANLGATESTIYKPYVKRVTKIKPLMNMNRDNM